MAEAPPFVGVGSGVALVYDYRVYYLGVEYDLPGPHDAHGISTIGIGASGVFSPMVGLSYTNYIGIGVTADFVNAVLLDASPTFAVIGTSPISSQGAFGTTAEIVLGVAASVGLVLPLYVRYSANPYITNKCWFEFLADGTSTRYRGLATTGTIGLGVTASVGLARTFAGVPTIGIGTYSNFTRRDFAQGISTVSVLGMGTVVQGVGFSAVPLVGIAATTGNLVRYARPTATNTISIGVGNTNFTKRQKVWKTVPVVLGVSGGLHPVFGAIGNPLLAIGATAEGNTKKMPVGLSTVSVQGIATASKISYVASSGTISVLSPSQATGIKTTSAQSQIVLGVSPVLFGEKPLVGIATFTIGASDQNTSVAYKPLAGTNQIVLGVGATNVLLRSMVGLTTVSVDGSAWWETGWAPTIIEDITVSLDAIADSEVSLEAISDFTVSLEAILDLDI